MKEDSLPKRLFSNKFFYIVVLLAVALLGMAIYCFSLYGKLYEYESVYEIEDYGIVCKQHEEKIETLSNQVKLLKKELEVANADATKELTETIQKNLQKKYITKNEDYTSKLVLTDIFYQKQNDTSIRAIAFPTISIQSKKYGSIQQKHALLLELTYKNQKWKITSIKQADYYSLDDFKDTY